MPDFDFEGRSEDQDSPGSCLKRQICSDEDLLMEQILDNINNTPLGRVLKNIALLPEVRRQKVLTVRQQLTEGSYNLNKRLDVALDKVLEELTA